MVVLKKANSILSRFKRDQSGLASLTWALSLTTIIAAMGAAMDFAMLSGADARSQSIADTTALAAAIYVKNYEQIPEDRTKGLIGQYTAQELGYDYKNWVINGAEGVNINVTYDNVKREATVTVEGQTRPTLMQILGYEALDFKAQTVVKYFEKDVQDPASIVLLLDNSGSMHFDDKPIDEHGNAPHDAVERMSALQSSATNFMELLNDTVGPQDGSNGEPRVLRTGMMAFDSDIIPARTVDMRWGLDWALGPNSEFNNMVPLEATNSAPPMEEARRWLNDLEPSHHGTENPGKTPLKYVILMTDGKNTIGLEEWVAREGTENWRAWLQTGTRTEYRTETETVTETNSVIVNQFIPNANCRIVSGYPRQNYWYNGRRYFTSQRVLCDEEVERTITRQVPYQVPEFEWVYREQEDRPNEPGDWEEGEFDIESNIRTRAECDILHATNVEVFTIGFALVPGQFETNGWADRPGAYTPFPSNYSREQGIEDANKARALLQYCASKPENFLTAEDSASLDAAFDRIGNTIIKEIIRISS